MRLCKNPFCELHNQMLWHGVPIPLRSMLKSSKDFVLGLYLWSENGRIDHHWIQCSAWMNNTHVNMVINGNTKLSCLSCYHIWNFVMRIHLCGFCIESAVCLIKTNLGNENFKSVYLHYLHPFRLQRCTNLHLELMYMINYI